MPWSPSLLLHHLTAQLAAGVGGSVDVCVPLASDQICNLRIRKNGTVAPVGGAAFHDNKVWVKKAAPAA